MSTRKYFLVTLIVMGLSLQSSLNRSILSGRRGVPQGALSGAQAAEMTSPSRPELDLLTARMVGFIILPNEERRAVIDRGLNKPYILKVGDEVRLRDGLATVVEITEDQVVFETKFTGGSRGERKTLVLTAPEVPVR